MATFSSDFLNTLGERGFIRQISDAEGLDALFARETVTAYIGFDPTAPSLHAGSLIPIMMLHWLQRTGHRPVVLMGGGTGMIGDPSFKDETRRLTTPERLKENLAGISDCFARYLRFGDGAADALMINNADWLMDLNHVAFLRDVGRHFSVNRMLGFDSVRLRLDREQSLSFLEFNYAILQAYDFVELNRRTGCRLQMGGSDQWGNIVSGIELGRRLGAPQLFALTAPLLTASSGAKMGKTAKGALWLDARRTSAYDFWQYWRNVEDADTGRFLRLYTTLPLDEVDRLAALGGREINEAKKILATEATALLHGRDSAEEAARTARETFEEGMAARTLPCIDVAESSLAEGVGLLTLLVRAGLAESNGEARRQVRGGAVRLNDGKVDDERRLVGTQDVRAGGVIKLSVGRKKHVLARPVR